MREAGGSFETKTEARFLESARIVENLPCRSRHITGQFTILFLRVTSRFETFFWGVCAHVFQDGGRHYGFELGQTITRST